MAAAPRQPSGMPGFIVVWLGQLVSVLATQMTQFALTVWVYERTGSATALGLMNVGFITPFILISPLAGALVDRHSRKLMMMVSDLAAGASTLAVLGLQAAGRLEVWHLFVAAVLNGLGNAFQWPAFSAAISTMVPKEQYGRANGLMSLVSIGPGVVAPLAAGALLPVVGLTGILTIDVVTFVLAVGALLVVHVPQPPRTEAGTQARASLWRESVYGFRYVFARPGLLGLLAVFLLGNLLVNMAATLASPMILARTSFNTLTLGSSQAAGAVGGVLGGLVMSAWGGPRRRVHGVLGGWALAGLLGMLPLGLGRSLPAWALGEFFFGLMAPLIDGTHQSIWQAKVAPDVQGRVFSARQVIGSLSGPVAPLIAGPLADLALEPGMRPAGALTPVFQGVVGAGPGAGMALLIVFAGLLTVLVGLGGYLVRAIRDVEVQLPDHEAAPAD
jgi:MFS family permease